MELLEGQTLAQMIDRGANSVSTPSFTSHTAQNDIPSRIPVVNVDVESATDRTPIPADPPSRSGETNRLIVCASAADRRAQPPDARASAEVIADGCRRGGIELTIDVFRQGRGTVRPLSSQTPNTVGCVPPRFTPPIEQSLNNPRVFGKRPLRKGTRGSRWGTAVRDMDTRFYSPIALSMSFSSPSIEVLRRTRPPRGRASSLSPTAARSFLTRSTA